MWAADAPSTPMLSTCARSLVTSATVCNRFSGWATSFDASTFRPIARTPPPTEFRPRIFKVLPGGIGPVFRAGWCHPRYRRAPVLSSGGWVCAAIKVAAERGELSRGRACAASVSAAVLADQPPSRVKRRASARSVRPKRIRPRFGYSLEGLARAEVSDRIHLHYREGRLGPYSDLGDHAPGGVFQSPQSRPGRCRGGQRRDDGPALSTVEREIDRHRRGAPAGGPPRCATVGGRRQHWLLGGRADDAAGIGDPLQQFLRVLDRQGRRGRSRRRVRNQGMAGFGGGPGGQTQGLRSRRSPEDQPTRRARLPDALRGGLVEGPPLGRFS